MDRGRPKKRSDASPINHKRTLRKQSQQAVEQKAAAEQKAFVTLPEGFKAAEIPSRLPQTEIDTLKHQALRQAAKFEVLCFKDVESLSRVSIHFDSTSWHWVVLIVTSHRNYER